MNPTPTEPIDPNLQARHEVVEATLPTVQSIVNDAARSASQLLNTDVSEQNALTIQSSSDTALDTSIPVKTTFYTAPDAAPVQVTTSGGNPIVKKQKSILLPIMLISIIVLLIGGASGFYFGYWTKSDVVYKRFQNKIVGVVDKTGSTQVDLINDYTYMVEVSSEDEKGEMGALSSSGRGVESGMDTSTDLTYKKAKINAELKLLNEDSGSPYQLYFKLKGIGPMFDAIYDKGSGGTIAPRDKLVKYDDKWIFVDLAGLLNQYTSETDTKPKALTKERQASGRGQFW
jgi:hypothetical protein